MGTREWDNPYNPFNSQKILAHGDRMEAIVNEMYLPPIVLNLDVTGRCQYRCNHCHHRRKQIGDRSLPDLSDRLLETLPYFLQHWDVNGQKIKAICCVGSKGDALLYPRLHELLRSVFFSGVEMGLVTNGYAFSDLMIEYSTFYTKFIGISMDAGTKESYLKCKNAPRDAWEKVLGNIEKLVKSVDKNKIRKDIGFKFLILPDTYKTLYEACRIAKDLGTSYVQIRPADLPADERAQINIFEVNSQIMRAMDDFNEEGVFEIVGVRHKFTDDFKKVLPKYCHLTPLTVTMTSDGKCWPCVDRRYDEKTLLCDCGTDGWMALKEAWGSSKHVNIVRNILNCDGKGPQCNIRCSNYGYDKFFNNFFVNDNVDRNLI